MNTSESMTEDERRRRGRRCPRETAQDERCTEMHGYREGLHIEGKHVMICSDKEHVPLDRYRQSMKL